MSRVFTCFPALLPPLYGDRSDERLSARYLPRVLANALRAGAAAKQIQWEKAAMVKVHG
jgi:hypothetical protein